MMRKGKWILIGVLFVGILSAFPCTGLAADFKLGAILPMSGGGAFYGEDAKRAIELAVETLGGKITVGGTTYNLKVVYYDDGAVPSEAVKWLRQLATLHRINVIIGPNGAAQSNAVATINEQEKVLAMMN